VTVTDTAALEPSAAIPLEVVSVAPLIAAAIQRTYANESLADLRMEV
jgi:phosphoribosylpyrophosphate synthetase